MNNNTTQLTNIEGLNTGIDITSLFAISNEIAKALDKAETIEDLQTLDKDIQTIKGQITIVTQQDQDFINLFFEKFYDKMEALYMELPSIEELSEAI